MRRSCAEAGAADRTAKTAARAATAATNGGALRLLNAPLSDERYGVGLRKVDVDGCEAVNRAITAMYQDGTAQKLLSRWFAATGLQLTTAVPQLEGCT